MATLSHIDRIADEIQEVRAWQGRRQRVQARADAFTPQHALALVDYIRQYPTVPFGVLEGLVQEQVPPDHPVARQIIDLHYRKQSYEGGSARGVPMVSNAVRNMAQWQRLYADELSDRTPGMSVIENDAPSSLPSRLVHFMKQRAHNRQPLTYESQLRIKGLLDSEGNLRLPKIDKRKEYQEGGARTTYGSRSDEKLERQFYELMQTIAADQKNNEPIPFINDNDEGRIYLFHPRTGAISAATREGDVEVDLPGPLDNIIDNGKQTIADFLDRRMPDPFGVNKYRVQSAGFGDTSSLKGTLRTYGMALNAPIQETYGQVRNVYMAQSGRMTDPSLFLQSQSDLGVALTHPDADPGSGFFVDPESDVAIIRHNRELNRGTIGEHAVTPGRWFADSVGLSVDSKPFNLVSGATDFAAQVFADPTNIATAGIAKVSQARRLFGPEEVTGLFSGIRRQFHRPTWNVYRQTDKGQTLLDTLAAASGDKSSAYDIWVGFNRKIDPALAQRIYEAETVDAVGAIMDEVTGTQIRSVVDVDRVPIRLPSNPLRDSLDIRRGVARLEDIANPQMLPDYRIDATNKLNAADNMERFLKVGRADDSVIREVFGRIARAQNKNDIEQAVEYAMEAENGILQAAGITSPQKRRQLTSLFKQSKDRAWDAFFGEIAADAPLRDVLMAKGIEVQSLDPQLTIEYLERYIPLPDVMRIRRVTADPKYRWLLTSTSSREIGKPYWPVSALDFVLEEFWKPLMLIGRAPAWVLRVVGEEQLRLAATGLNGMFNHPLSAIAIMIGRKGEDSRLARFGRLKTAPSGDGWDEYQEFEEALSRVHGGSIRRAGATSNTPVHFDKLNPDMYDDYLKAWADQVAMLRFDPVARNLIKFGPDETLKWLKEGKGRTQLRKLRSAEPDKFVTDEQIRAYLTDTLGERIQILTKNDSRILDALKEGKFKYTNNDGESVEIPIFRKGGPKLNNKYIKHLEENYLEEIAPRLVKGSEPISPSRIGVYHNAVNWLFAHTMSMMTDLMSRSPAMRQLTWQQIADIIPYTDASTRAALIENARQSALPMSTMRQLLKNAKKDGGAKITSVEEATHIAMGYALDATKKRLYDLSNRGMLAESFKTAAPFINAWQEIVTTWPKLLVGQDYGYFGKVANVMRVSHRAQQTIEGGRRNGWFMKNQFGEEVFVFPFSEAFTKWMTGVPVPMTGRVEGLSMMFDVMPGLGPVAAVPVSWMMEGKPSFQNLYGQILPYGAPGERDPNQALNALAYFPSWVQKLAIAASAGLPPGLDKIPGLKDIYPSKEEVLWDHNAWMNVQKDVMKYLISTGDFDPTTREGMLELQAAAKEAAKDLYYIRAGLQFFAPTAPAFDFLVQDKSGKLLSQWVITEEYYGYLDQGKTLDEAAYILMDKYGFDMLSLTVPKTRAATYNVPRTAEAGAWLAENRDIKEKYPGAYGFFAPQGGDLDYSVLVEQFATGDVQSLTPGGWLNLRNDMMKTLEYNYYKDQVGNNPSDAQEAWLRQVRSELEEAYPSSTKGILDKPDYEELIPELYDAIRDPKLRDTEVAQALEEYFYYRDQAMQAAIDAGYAGFQRPNAMRPTREWLSGIALSIIKDYPAFELVWSTTLSREFERELR